MTLDATCHWYTCWPLTVPNCWRSRQPDIPFFLPSALALLYGSIWVTQPDVTLCAPCEDKPKLELSHRVPTAVGLTFSQQPVQSSPFPDAEDVGV